MNQRIGFYSAALNLLAVLGFAVSMLFAFDFGSYFSSMMIAFSFVPMICAFASAAGPNRKAAGLTASAFAAAYAAIILLVYFAQLTTVRLSALGEEAAALLDFRRLGLLFNYDLLGYALMALSTFFAGLTVRPRSRAERWLKRLLTAHGVFFLSCLVVPMLGLFKADGPAWVGVALLEFWCAYFCPVSALSALYFLKRGKSRSN